MSSSLEDISTIKFMFQNKLIEMIN